MPSLFKILPTTLHDHNIPEEARSRLEIPEQCWSPRRHARKRHIDDEDISIPAAKVFKDHNYAKSGNEVNSQPKKQDPEITNKKLKSKIRNLRQQLRRSKKKMTKMEDIINNLQQNLIIKSEIADELHASFYKLQLSIFYNTKNNTNKSPCGRRYTDDIKEFALTLNYYSPKAYQYVRSILPLPNPSLIRKWSSSCEPGFLVESFESLTKDLKSSPTKKDCCMIIDAMSIRKQAEWDVKKEKYSGFINYGEVTPEKPDTMASEALLFLLVGTRTHWKCPIGYFLSDKMTANIQAQLVELALIKAAEAGLRVWSVTADGTSVNLSTFRMLGCTFGTTYETTVTKFKHPTQDYFVHVILDPCHMLKLARNALADLSTFCDNDGGKVEWPWAYFQNLYAIQEKEGLKLGNRLSTQHMQFQKHKMNVQLAAQTLSSSVADAIEFLDVSMKLPEFKDSQPTITFIRTIDRLFDILNSRNPVAKGYKQPLRPESKDTWETMLKTTANYLLTLKTVADNDHPEQLLSTHPRKTFVIGFVATIKSTIEMANNMFTMEECPFKYFLTYKYSQDHL